MHSLSLVSSLLTSSIPIPHTTATTPFNFKPLNNLPNHLNSHPLHTQKRSTSGRNDAVSIIFNVNKLRRNMFVTATGGPVSDLDQNARRIAQSALWVAEGVYIIWLFLLPYAPVSTSIHVQSSLV